MHKYLFHNSSVNYCYRVGRAIFNLSIAGRIDMKKTKPTIHCVHHRWKLFTL